VRRHADTRPPVSAPRLAEARRIEQDNPGWHVWVSSLDRWWAVRQGPDARYGRDDPRPMTLDADDAAGLSAVLAQNPSPHPA
jgi:hypothetical protein